MDEQDFLTSLCDPGELTSRRRECLLLAAELWREGDDRKSLERRVREEWKARHGQEYGSVVLAFLLLTALGAAISWAVQRLLSRWWPAHTPQETRAMCRSWGQP